MIPTLWIYIPGFYFYRFLGLGLAWCLGYDWFYTLLGVGTVTLIWRVLGRGK